MTDAKKTHPREPSPRKRAVFSLRFLATLAAAALVSLTAVVLSGANEQSMRETLEQQARIQLLLDARNLALSSVDALLSEFPELTLVPLAKDLKNDRPELLEVTILNHQSIIKGSPDSRSIGQLWKPAEGDADPGFLLQLLPGEKLFQNDTWIQVESPVNYGGESNLGRVVLIMDKGYIDAQVQALRKKQLTIAGVMLVIAMALSAALMSLVFRPMAQLRKSLDRIGRGDLDSPMKESGLAELSMLATALNNMASQLKLSHKVAKLREKEVIATQKEVINTLGQVVESRSSETANHTNRVGAMSYELALLAGLPEDEAQLLRAASPMHDVGKIGIPDSILNKPGKLTPEEYNVMKQHPEIGFRILNKSERPILKSAAIIAYEHHERWDGMGYPRGLMGEDIHPYGRIVSLVDVFDALHSDRVYREAMPLEMALAIIDEGKGTQFDPKMVELFRGNLKRFLAISEKYADQPKTQETATAETPATTPELISS